MLKDKDTINFINKVFGSVEDPSRILIGFALKQLLIFLLIIPAMVPSLIAPSSIIMEKENNTLEPLLVKNPLLLLYHLL